MEFPKTKKMLKRFGKAVVRAGKIRLTAAGMGSSRLIKNFSYQLGKIEPGNLPKAISFTFGGSAKYWQFVDEGVRGKGGYSPGRGARKGKRGGTGMARGGKSPFKFKSNNIARGVIKKWITKKGISIRGTDGKFKSKTPSSIAGAAFVIGRAIAQRGLTRTQFFSAPYKKNMKYYINKITNAYAEDIEDDIVSKMKDIK
tara:strand:+ start:184 stop:780 length:597 start_codon:yes stop_codon:yes gene_type:complete